MRNTVIPSSWASRATSSHSAARLWGIQTGRRLVQEQDPRLVHQRHGEVQAPLHAARIAAHPAIRGFLEAHPLEQRLGALTALGAPGFPGASPAG